MKMTCVFFEAALTGLFIPLPHYFLRGGLAGPLRQNKFFFLLHSYLRNVLRRGIAYRHTQAAHGSG